MMPAGKRAFLAQKPGSIAHTNPNIGTNIYFWNDSKNGNFKRMWDG